MLRSGSIPTERLGRNARSRTRVRRPRGLRRPYLPWATTVRHRATHRTHPAEKATSTNTSSTDSATTPKPTVFYGYQTLKKIWPNGALCTLFIHHHCHGHPDISLHKTRSLFAQLQGPSRTPPLPRLQELQILPTSEHGPITCQDTPKMRREAP